MKQSKALPLPAPKSLQLFLWALKRIPLVWIRDIYSGKISKKPQMILFLFEFPSAFKQYWVKEIFVIKYEVFQELFTIKDHAFYQSWINAFSNLTFFPSSKLKNDYQKINIH